MSQTKAELINAKGDAAFDTDTLYIDSTNNRVGVGTTSPGNPLAISQTVSTTFGNAGTYLGLGGAENTSGQKVLIGFGYKGASGDEYPAVIGYTATSNAGNQNGAIVFGTRAVTTNTAPTERARIDSSGRLLVGTSSNIDTMTLQIVSTTAGQVLTRHASAPAGEYWRTGVDGANNGYIVYNHNGTGVFIGNGSTSWTGTSDERLKTDLQPIVNGLEKISGLRAVTGRFKTDDSNMSRSFLIAQDVQAVLPEAVDTTDPDRLGLRYTEVIPLLVAALKESKERIEQLEADIASIKVS